MDELGAAVEIRHEPTQYTGIKTVSGPYDIFSCHRNVASNAADRCKRVNKARSPESKSPQYVTQHFQNCSLRVLLVNRERRMQIDLIAAVN